MIDYIIVGSGLAGISFAETAMQHQKSILVIDNQSQSSSLIAGGLYNPVILKRFSEVWQAEQQLEIYRQAVLGKAFEGAFTANWRKLNPNENANTEFETIKAEREELYTKKIEEWILACEEATVKKSISFSTSSNVISFKLSK